MKNEDAFLAIAREMRLIAEEIEQKIAASQRGELFADLDGIVYRPKTKATGDENAR